MFSIPALGTTWCTDTFVWHGHRAISYLQSMGVFILFKTIRSSYKAHRMRLTLRKSKYFFSPIFITRYRPQFANAPRTVRFYVVWILFKKRLKRLARNSRKTLPLDTLSRCAVTELVVVRYFINVGCKFRLQSVSSAT